MCVSIMYPRVKVTFHNTSETCLNGGISVWLLLGRKEEINDKKRAVTRDGKV